MNIFRSINFFKKIAEDQSIEINHRVFVDIINNIAASTYNINYKLEDFNYYFNNYYVASKNEYDKYIIDNLILDRANDGSLIKTTESMPLNRYVKKIFTHFIKQSALTDWVSDWLIAVLCKEAREKFNIDKVNYPFFVENENKKILLEVIRVGLITFRTQLHNVRSVFNKFQDNSVNAYESVPDTAKAYDYLEYSKVSGSIEDKKKTKNREKTTIGRYIRRQLNISTEQIPDNIIAAIATEYSSAVSEIKDFDKQLKHLEGEDIISAYREMDARVHSCMTGRNCRKVEMYALNQDRIKLVAFKDKARALLWTCDDGAKVLDRAYPSGSKYVSLLRNWAKKNNIILRKNPDSVEYGDTELEDGSTRHVTMKHTGKFPYADTFCFGKIKSGDIYNSGTLILSNKREDNDYHFHDTEGEFITLEKRYPCSECNQLHNESNLRQVIDNDKKYCRDCIEKLFDPCSYCGHYVVRGTLVQADQNRQVCQSCFDTYFIKCSGEDCKVILKKNPSWKYEDKHYCFNCRKKYFQQCKLCLGWFPKEKIFSMKLLSSDKDKETPEFVEMNKVCQPCMSYYHDYICKECGDFTAYKLINKTCEDCKPELYADIVKEKQKEEIEF